MNKFNVYREQFKKKVNLILSSLYQRPGDEVLVKRTAKQRPSNNTKHPDKRSKYIGVSKNGSHWQSLVVWDKEKLYIATTPSEEKAARIVDFYTLLYRFNKGKMNWEYTVHEAINLINTYKHEINRHGSKNTSL